MRLLPALNCTLVPIYATTSEPTSTRLSLDQTNMIAPSTLQFTRQHGTPLTIGQRTTIQELHAMGHSNKAIQGMMLNRVSLRAIARWAKRDTAS